MAAGSVDAMTSFEPYLAVAEKEGIGTMLMRFGEIDPNPTCLVLTPALIEKSPETVQVFLKSWLDGVEFWRNNIEGKLHSVNVKQSSRSTPNRVRHVKHTLSLH